MALLKKALERGSERAAALEAGKQPWAEKKGKVVRGFVSAVDGSVQPYGVIVPAKLRPRASRSGSTWCCTAAASRSA